MKSRTCLPMLMVLFVTSPLLGQAPPAADAIDPTVVGQLEHSGWLLVGARGKHYVFGGLAIADYRDSAGQRRIVVLQRDDQLGTDKHLYFRELGEGHRWSFARRPGADGTYGIWIQLAATEASPQPAWLPFDRARLERPSEGGALPTTGGATSVLFAPCRRQ
ncbi:MAG: hypothetical protein SFU86_02260 [Pirellulaceae bacterium]|nr:hypothetical protein [Pirellulaceae bacterium]